MRCQCRRDHRVGEVSGRIDLEVAEAVADDTGHVAKSGSDIDAREIEVQYPEVLIDLDLFGVEVARCDIQRTAQGQARCR